MSLVVEVLLRLIAFDFRLLTFYSISIDLRTVQNLDILRNDLGLAADLAVLLPTTRLQFAFYIDLHALLEVLLSPLC